jgi:hypothetical protein
MVWNMMESIEVYDENNKRVVYLEYNVGDVV